MPTAADVVRIRRRRRPRKAGARVAVVLGLGVSTLAIAALGATAVGLGRAVFRAAAGLPDASALEGLFGPPGEESLRPTLLFDRTGEVLLAELGHPLATGRRWQSLDRLPPHVAQAVVAVLEPGFWQTQNQSGETLARLLRALSGARPAELASISERLGAQTLLPAGASEIASLVLSDDLDGTYPRSKILEWLLNSADFGNLAFGIDAAALVYFGKHADELTVGEAAMLATVLRSENPDPFEGPATARRLRDDGLTAMRRAGWLSAEEERAARDEPLALLADAARQSVEGVGFVAAVWQELAARYGPGVAAQGGARITTTLDLDLQLQADCVVRTHLARMEGQPPTTVVPAADGSVCVAASLLPPVRPGDVGVDHGLGRGGVVLLDPVSGEILALVGPGRELETSAGAAAPLIYLGALARGYTPATMLVVPAEADAPSGGSTLMRLRAALAGGTAEATLSVLDLIGAETASRTLERLGLEVESAESGVLAEGGFPVAPIDLAGALGTLANRGVQIGSSPIGLDGSVDPILIREARRADGRPVDGGRLEGRAVVSEGLAYLMTHMLADETVRWPRLGAGNVLEIGRPAAAAIGDASGTHNWAVGFTPQRVLVSWTGAVEGGGLTGVHAQNGAAPIWHALMRYAHRALPPQDWERPADVTEIQVCDPSGYLATPHCPNVVREVFLLGTEPTHADSLYRPIRINRETGRLATYFTPLDQVEEKVYFVPPPETSLLGAEGADRPPDEYDRISPLPEDPEVHLEAPSFFETVSGSVDVRGSAGGEDFESYRLDAGAGLDPQAWLQIGTESDSPVSAGLLARWHTTDLEGVHILRLTVLRRDGTVQTAAVPVTVDNTAPRVALVLPPDGATLTPEEAQEVVIEADVLDETGLDKVVFFLDGRPIGTRTRAPWSVHWPIGPAGEHLLKAQAFDLAGNSVVSDEIKIRIGG